MSWLLFLDESGHDHKTCPYEVRGGIALHASKLWPFVQHVQAAEAAAFGTNLRDYGIELKGAKLLDKHRFGWARQNDWMPAATRRKHSRGFLTKGLDRCAPNRDEFTAYGQASVEMARSVFAALCEFDARLFAAVIPRDVIKPATPGPEYLRKDHVFLLERYFYFLERQRAHGLLVLDAVSKGTDQRLGRQIEGYFSKTYTGRCRTAWIVPMPMFVTSDLTIPIQAADLAIYCVNWGFRLPDQGMGAPIRDDIAAEFGLWLNQLQYRGHGYRNGRVFDSYGIVFVPNPYGDGRH